MFDTRWSESRTAETCAPSGKSGGCPRARCPRLPPRSLLHRRFHIKLGLRLPQRLGVDLQHDVVEAARMAEAAGYTSLWTYERLLFPQSPLEPYAPPDVPWPESSRQVADSLA